MRHFAWDRLRNYLIVIVGLPFVTIGLYWLGHIQWVLLFITGEQLQNPSWFYYWLLGIGNFMYCVIIMLVLSFLGLLITRAIKTARGNK